MQIMAIHGCYQQLCRLCAICCLVNCSLETDRELLFFTCEEARRFFSGMKITRAILRLTATLSTSTCANVLISGSIKEQQSCKHMWAIQPLMIIQIAKASFGDVSPHNKLFGSVQVLSSTMPGTTVRS